MSKTVKDPVADFAFDVELPLRQARAEMCACHEILGRPGALGEEVQDAIAHLIAATHAKIDQMLAAHAKAFAQAQAQAGRSA